ncbi:hypothetical protein [Flavivirga algicola]|uniref:Uncharacterized protein n=1 Tax=Flavivirga algicola TaxID=2729136 RepID=A0ABX1RWQ4_9FLAO|nr:hypothetical protein [Flavivirga algicola]NMH87989.1 hypothetical protein [Flavivirga algicola]
MVGTIRYTIVALFFIQFSIGQQKYAQVQQEGLKKLDGVDKSFLVFEGEILERKNLIHTLPNKTKLVLGNGNDMKTFDTIPKTLSETIIIQKLIKRQKVFMNDGKLYEGYLFNFNHDELVIEDKKEIKVANYLEKLIRLKKKGKVAINSYPYDASGLVYFYKSTEKFSNPYIRIVIPGYTTAYVDKNIIEDIPPVYDTNAFEEHIILIEEGPTKVLYGKDKGILYKWDAESIEGTKLNLGDGKYLITQSTGSVKLQFNIINGIANKETVKEEGKSFLNSLNIWHIIIIIVFGILVTLLIWFRKTLFGKDKQKNKDNNESNPGSHRTDRSEYHNSFETNNKAISRVDKTSPKSLKEVTKSITQKVEESQKEIERKIEKLRREINSNDNHETKSLREQLQLLKSEKQDLEKEKVGLNREVLNLNETNKKNQEKFELLTPKIERFEKQGLFIENHHTLIDKLVPFFNHIKHIENQLIESIGSETNQAVKKFQSIVLAKYLKNNTRSEFNKWDTILETLKNNDGLVVDKDLIHKIENKTSDPDKLKGMEWIVVNEVIISKINALLIILEELSNTSKITDAGNDFSTNTAAKHKTDLISKMKQLFGIHIDHVTLFSNFQTYSNIKATQEKVSYDLSSVTLQMGDIKEIITYGMKLKDKEIETLVIEK